MHWLFLSCRSFRFLHFGSRQEKFGTLSPDWGVFKNGGPLGKVWSKCLWLTAVSLETRWYLFLWKPLDPRRLHSTHQQLDNHNFILKNTTCWLFGELPPKIKSGCIFLVLLIDLQHKDQDFVFRAELEEVFKYAAARCQPSTRWDIKSCCLYCTSDP